MVAGADNHCTFIIRFFDIFYAGECRGAIYIYSLLGNLNMSKIILTRPNYNSHLITPPLGLGYLASYLKTKGHDVKIIDGLNLGYSNSQISEVSSDADIVGIYCLSDYFLKVIDLSQRLKKINKIVVIGGPHASALPELTVKETGADFAVIGEGEITFAELAEALEKGRQVSSIPGVFSSGTRQFIKRAFIQNLDALPFPDWQQLDPRNYKKAPHGGLIKKFPVAPITTTRGCPYECTFCASPLLWERTIRYRSPRNIIDEIVLLVKDYGVKEIHFEDDNLTLDRGHIEGICHLLIETKLNISWAAPNGIRVDTVNGELLALMKKSGCYFIAFGIESGNQNILNNIKKGTKLETIENAVRMANKKGIITQGFFIFGLPGETKQTIRESLNFAKRIGLDKAQFLLLDILPGSQLWEQLSGQFTIDWSKPSYQDVTWVPDTILKQDLKLAQSKAFREFFLRPKPLMFFLIYFKFSQLPFIIKRLKDFRVFSLSKPIEGCH